MRKKRRGGTYASISLHDIILHVHSAFWHTYTVDYRNRQTLKIRAIKETLLSTHPSSFKL
jgi:hypothetical protein